LRLSRTYHSIAVWCQAETATPIDGLHYAISLYSCLVSSWNRDSPLARWGVNITL